MTCPGRIVFFMRADIVDGSHPGAKPIIGSGVRVAACANRTGDGRRGRHIVEKYGVFRRRA